MRGPPFVLSKYASLNDLLKDKCEWLERELELALVVPQKPEPSRLEIAAMMAAAIFPALHTTEGPNSISRDALQQADALIKRERETRGASQ